MVPESRSCTLSVALLECAVFCAVGKCCNLSSEGSLYLFIVCSHEIASAKMLSLHVMSYSCSSIAHLSNFTVVMPLDRNGSRGLWSHLRVHFVPLRY